MRSCNTGTLLLSSNRKTHAVAIGITQHREQLTMKGVEPRDLKKIRFHLHHDALEGRVGAHTVQCALHDMRAWEAAQMWVANYMLACTYLQMSLDMPIQLPI